MQMGECMILKNGFICLEQGCIYIGGCPISHLIYVMKLMTSENAFTDRQRKIRLFLPELCTAQDTRFDFYGLFGRYMLKICFNCINIKGSPIIPDSGMVSW